MTGLLLGLPSIALSQVFRDRENVRWDTARALAPGAIRQLLAIEHDAPVSAIPAWPARERTR
nr:hypothetical protein [Paraburkholderia terrae]